MSEPLYEAPEEDIPEDLEALEGWLADDLARASRLMWVAQKLGRDRARIQAAAQALIAPIEAWAAEEDRKLAARADYIDTVLKAYALRQRAADDRSKTLTTPYGVVTTRTVPPKWTIDMEAAIASARRAGVPQLVKVETKETFRLADAKRILTITEQGVLYAGTGQLLDGITVEPATVSATVVPDLGGAS